MKLIGNPPINRFWFFLAKLSAAVCLLYFFSPFLFRNIPCYASPITTVTGVLLFLTGGAILWLGVANLGKSTAMGLPINDTELKTQGLYRFSRNPIYLGLFVMCAGSCLNAMHPVNILCACLSIILHHRIILAEERFLASRFGEAWEQYRRKVRRYL